MIKKIFAAGVLLSIGYRAHDVLCSMEEVHNDTIQNWHNQAPAMPMDFLELKFKARTSVAVIVGATMLGVFDCTSLPFKFGSYITSMPLIDNYHAAVAPLFNYIINNACTICDSAVSALYMKGHCHDDVNAGGDYKWLN